jgi:manganese efflux pump family protein
VTNLSPHHLWLFALVLVPLALDTFILSAALGLAGLSKKHRVRTSLILASFEAVMPIVGVVIGRGIGHFVGSFAGYTAAIVIGLAGLLMLRPGKGEDTEAERVKLLAHFQGMAIIDLGISISLDELTIGMSLGLLDVALVYVVIYLGVQAFAAAQLGLWLGSRLSDTLREGAEQLAGVLLLLTALALVALKLTGHQP